MFESKREKCVQSPLSSPTVDLYRQAAAQLLRAIRGGRSQRAFAMRLGYRGNPITDWERAKRSPTACEMLRASELCGLAATQAFEHFARLPPPKPCHDARSLAVWLNALRGDLPISELATRVERSRYTVGRWLAGRTQPRLHEWLQLVDAITERVHDWVAALVPISEVASLASAHYRAEAVRTLAAKQPWTEAVLRVLETQHYRNNPEVGHATLAAWLNVEPSTLQAALEGLIQTGILQRAGERYEALRPLSVDTRPAAIAALKRHWLGVAQKRAADVIPHDWFGYNVISCSQKDLQRIRDCLRRAYQESRAIVAASEPSETSALLLMNLIHWAPPD